MLTVIERSVVQAWAEFPAVGSGIDGRLWVWCLP